MLYHGVHASGPFVATAFLLLAASVSAQEPQQPPVQIPTVEIVATRIPEAPHNVPASIEVISGSDLRARGARSLSDALSLATGVAIAPGGDAGPASSVPEFWGLREFDAFLLVVDGVPWGGALNPAISTLSLRDVERIEILRGPAPVTYGATSFVGVIHVVHSPAANRSIYADIHGGSYGTGGGGVDFGLPSLGSWTSRLSADVDRIGFRDDHTSITRGHGLLRTSRSFASGQLWVTSDFNVLRQDPASPHPRVGTELTSAVPVDANHNPAGAYINDNKIAVAAGFDRGLFSSATWGTTASFAFTANDQFRGFLTDVSDTPNNASGYKETIDIHDFYADTHIIWPALSQLRFMAGGDALIAGGEARGATFTYTAPLSGAQQASVAEPSNLNLDAGNDRRFLGAYTSAEWRPGDRFSLSGGLRFNSTAESRGEGAEVTHNRVSGSAGALLGLYERDIDHIRLFANYRNTFKPAAFDFSLAENEGVLDPETSQSYEAGLKVRALAGRLDFEASAFRMDFENLVTATIVNNLPALINSGKTRFKGIELETELRMPFSTLARATYSFHDGRFVDFVQDFGGVPTQLGGNRIEMSARHLASAGFTYAPENGLTAYTTANYTGDRYLDKRNNSLAKPFTTFDAGIGFRENRFELRLDGRNLTNRRDPVSESEFGDAQYYRVPARTIQTGVAVRY
ncbi:MAG TPA: TonB-dependent receptor [Gemmatimonadaceae bacterium]|nr:TonB-dependent receptor [Gemmatimonadaceae bacterium]